MPDPKDSCFCCGKPLSTAFDIPRATGKTIGAVDDALVFRATGNYGSAIFDPTDDQYIEILVCDACVVERQARLVHWAEPGAEAQAPPYGLRA